MSTYILSCPLCKAWQIEVGNTVAPEVEEALLDHIYECGLHLGWDVTRV